MFIIQRPDISTSSKEVKQSASTATCPSITTPLTRAVSVRGQLQPKKARRYGWSVRGPPQSQNLPRAETQAASKVPDSPTTGLALPGSEDLSLPSPPTFPLFQPRRMGKLLYTYPGTAKFRLLPCGKQVGALSHSLLRNHLRCLGPGCSQ